MRQNVNQRFSAVIVVLLLNICGCVTTNKNDEPSSKAPPRAHDQPRTTNLDTKISGEERKQLEKLLRECTAENKNMCESCLKGDDTKVWCGMLAMTAHVQKNYLLSKLLFRKMCFSENNGVFCGQLGEVEEELGNKDESNASYARGCNLGDSLSCATLGTQATNLNSAVAYLKLGRHLANERCNKGEASSCDLLRELSIIEAQKESALIIDTLMRNCRVGNEDVCFEAKRVRQMADQCADMHAQRCNDLKVRCGGETQTQQCRDLKDPCISPKEDPDISDCYSTLRASVDKIVAKYKLLNAH